MRIDAGTFLVFFGKTLLRIANYLSSLGLGGFISFLFSHYNLMILPRLSADGREAPRRRRWPIAVRAAPGPTETSSIFNLQTTQLNFASLGARES